MSSKVTCRHASRSPGFHQAGSSSHRQLVSLRCPLLKDAEGPPVGQFHIDTWADSTASVENGADMMTCYEETRPKVLQVETRARLLV